MQAFLSQIPWWVISLLVTALILFVVLTTFAYAMVFERKIMAWMQLRPGPNRVGPWGMMQPAADAVKMLFKEDLTPNTADPLIYKLAPFISLICAMGAFSVIPFSEQGGTIWGVSDVNAGILAIFAITSIGVYGISLAGWASGSKFPLLGSVRSTAQMISYELAMTMSVDRRARSSRARRRLRVSSTRRASSGISCRRSSVSSSTSSRRVAETNRAPFDLVEAETELVGGFHTEYSGLALRAVLHRGISQHDHGRLHRDATLPRRLERAARPDLSCRGSSGSSSKRGLFIFMYIWLRTDAAALALRPAS